jgi:hypothetical protein
VLPKGRGEWLARAIQTAKVLAFETIPLNIHGYQNRLKMDDAIHADMDVVTTEENGGWGVIWFDNRLRN